LTRFTHTVESVADKAKPQLVLVSAGFDAHHADPVGSLGLEVEDFVTLTQRVLDIAAVHCGGRVVSCLEGGYDLNALAESVRVHLETLLGAC
jgi:acetoin utilization deacetylase AcuC-like enzyme